LAHRGIPQEVRIVRVVVRNAAVPIGRVIIRQGCEIKPQTDATPSPAPGVVTAIPTAVTVIAAVSAIVATPISTVIATTVSTTIGATASDGSAAMLRERRGGECQRGNAANNECE
jgi:hypothetical protein